MIWENNATRLQREIRIRLCELFFSGDLERNIDRLPLQLRPRGGDHIRCCVYRDRAIIKYRCMTALGTAVEDEEDELTPLSEYARRVGQRDGGDKPARTLTVLDEACLGCVERRHYVTNACQGCLARPCTLQCPKKAISFQHGRAMVDTEKCVNCGKCVSVCPYHAIVYVPVPCEEACPVKAITRGENGKQVIDQSRCIHCGKCKQACPFGAVMEVSRLFDVLTALRGPRKVVALFAPALAGQFDADHDQVVAALTEMGFDGVMEVAWGAEKAAELEAHEFAERQADGAPMMTSSCCPAWTNLATKHLPGIQPFVSTTPTPLHLTARRARDLYPDALTVFIGPCVAKRAEGAGDGLLDYVISFEELGAALVAAGIQVESLIGQEGECPAGPSGRSFAMSGGVAQAVQQQMPDGVDLKPRLINGLDKKSVALLKGMPRARGEANFLEVMACEGGCVGGPSVFCQPATARKRLPPIPTPTLIASTRD